MNVTRNLRWYLTAKDGTNSSSLMRGHFKPGTSVDDGLSALTGLRAAIEALSDCTFVRQAVTISQSQQPRPAPTGPTPVELVGALFFAASSPDKFGLCRIPGILADAATVLGCGSGIVIDSDDARILAVIEQITSGLWCNPFGSVLSTYVSGYIREER